MLRDCVLHFLRNISACGCYHGYLPNNLFTSLVISWEFSVHFAGARASRCRITRDLFSPCTPDEWVG